MLILNAGSAGTAVDKHTGRIVWSSGPGPGGYATPVPFEHQGRRPIALFSARDLVAVEPRTGREWWRHLCESGRDVNAADPIFSDGKLHFLEQRLRALAVARRLARGRVDSHQSDASWAWHPTSR